MADTVNFTFPREPRSVPEARDALERFAGRHAANAVYDASLCLSELVTNAVQHPGDGAGDAVEITAAVNDTALRVEVADRGGAFQPADPTPGHERGWGLFIVSRLASDWGADSSERHTMVWFEIDLAR